MMRPQHGGAAKLKLKLKRVNLNLILDLNTNTFRSIVWNKFSWLVVVWNNSEHFRTTSMNALSPNLETVIPRPPISHGGRA